MHATHPATGPTSTTAPAAAASRAVQQREVEASRDGRAGENLLYAWRLRGPLDAERLTAAVIALARRHEPLRTTFAALPPTGPERRHDDGDAWQRTAGRAAERSAHPTVLQLIAARPPEPLPWSERTVGGATEAARLDAARATAAALGREPFPLADGPLWRAALLHVGDDDAVLALAVAHVVWDAWSAGRFLRELLELHAGPESADRRKPPPLQLADVAAWERAQAADGAAGSPLLPPARRAGHLPAQLHVRLAPPAVGTALARLARDLRTTPSVVCATACAISLGAATDREPVPLAIADARRDDPQLAEALGCFVGHALVEVAVAPEATFGELATALHRELHLGRPQQLDALLRSAPGAACDLSFNFVPAGVAAALDGPAEPIGGIAATRVAGLPEAFLFPTRARPWRTRLEWELWSRPDGALDATLVHDAHTLGAPVAERLAIDLSRLLRALASPGSARTTVGRLTAAAAR